VISPGRNLLKTLIEVEGKQVTLAWAIRRLQEIKAEIAWLRGLQIREETEEVREQEYDDNRDRYVVVAREILHVSDLSEVKRAEEIEALHDLFEQINDAVEAANHRTEIERAVQ